MSTEKIEPPKENSIVPNSIDTCVALLEQSIGSINQTLIRIELQMKDGFNRIDARFEKIDARFEKTESKFELEFKEIKKDIKYNFRYLFTIICGLGAMVAHGFHWF